MTDIGHTPTPEIDHRAGKDERGYFIRTFTGKKLHWDHVEEHDYDIEDITHALATRVRWTGHVSIVDNLVWSIGQHSCLVHDIIMLNGGTISQRKQGLMHDAPEAYMPDFPSPLKWWMIARGDRAIDDLDKRVDAAISRKFNVQYPRDKIVKLADLTMLATENRDFMPDGEERGYMPEPLSARLIPWSINRTYAEFKDRWNLICEKEKLS